MKTALITTTINVPRVLSLYRAHDPWVDFFVAGDLKTPAETAEFCETMGHPGFKIGCTYLSPDDQRKWKSSDMIPWNSDSRRNFALLEALKSGAELIISVDDDMAPMQERFWFDVRFPFQNAFHGLQVGSLNHWLDVGEFTIPKAVQRGLPYDESHYATAAFVSGVEIGAAQGIILGIPDTDACTAISQTPFIHSATDILRHGFVANPRAHAVFNSQLTAFRAELAPAFAQFYFAQGRNTDIFASMLMRRVMREKNWYTYYGPPYGFHARQPRPLLKDLQAERYGVDNIAAYAEYLNRAPLPKDISVVEQCRILAQGWNGPELEAAMAWYEDCEKVLA